jgi:subtilisin family serine protease
LGHGTAVAGVIGATGNNGVGVAGVAWRVQIMACKFLDAAGDGVYSDALECINYAKDNGARIINASFIDTEYNSLLYSALESCRSAGIIIVAAAGNSTANNDVTPFYPASFDLDNLVAVAATTRTDALWPFSNYGRTNVDLAAPGSEIYMPTFDSDSSYNWSAGTSFAAPHVTGALALMLARYPTNTYQQTLDRLLTSVDRLPSLSGKCVTGGRLNLAKALSHWPPVLEPLTGGTMNLQVRLRGEPSSGYVLQASTNLSDWNGLATNATDRSGSTLFWLTNSPSGQGQFFRGRLVE